ncbi:Lrp/AsnC family transcriptional regulator [Streptomyces sp. NBC_01012]|uniref:Lrp/AsnC family transcriptional regulator n=1 Tax=Streptomyces sp. NBC_01012 TaxID=2903717 RepID=UPI00386B1D60
MLHHFRTPGHADWEGSPGQLTGEQRKGIRAGAPHADEPCSGTSWLKDEDRALLTALSQDARQSSTRLAAATGQAESAVRRRLEALLSFGAIHLDPVQLVHPIGATLHLDVSPRYLHDAGEELAQHEPTTCVAAATGPTTAIAASTVHDLYTYAHSTLADVEGVLHIEAGPARGPRPRDQPAAQGVPVRRGGCIIRGRLPRTEQARPSPGGEQQCRTAEKPISQSWSPAPTQRRATGSWASCGRP